MRKLKKGCWVEIDGDFCYTNLETFAFWHPWYKMRWAYKMTPNESHIFKVKGVHHHKKTNDYDITQRIVVVEDEKTKQLFFMGENGVVVI